MTLNIMANNEEWEKITVKVGNTLEEIQKLNYYTPIVQEMAMCFGINVVLDATSGPGPSTHPHKTDRVYIHLDSYPSNFKLLGPVFSDPDLIFGYRTPEDFYLMEISDVGSQKNQQGFNIKSPEGFKVGFVYPGHIYIYPGILEHKFWKNGEDEDILSIILYMVLPEAAAIGSDIRFHSHSFLTGYDNVKYLLRSRLDSRKNISSRLEKYLEKNLFLALQEMAVKMDQQQEEGRKLATEDYKLTKEIIECEEKLERVRDSIQLRDFGQDFDQILTIDKIKCVRIGEVHDKRSLIIFTEPTEQIPNSLDDERFDIGSFEIVISPNWDSSTETTRSAVSFYQTRRVGKHRHFHANDANASKVCFGNNMLNPVIDRLVADFDVIPLVHILMNFLIKESTKPSISDGKLGLAKIFPNTDIYTDSQDLEEERDSFSSFMQDILIKKLVKDLEVKIAELTKKRDEIRKNRSQIRNAIAIQAEKIKETEKEFGQAGRKSASQAGLILEDKQVFWVTVNEEEILIYFSMPEIKKEFPRGNRGFVLKIARDQHLELIEPRKFEPIVLSNSDVPNFISAEQESTLFKWRARGNFSDILSLVKEFIANGLREP